MPVLTTTQAHQRYVQKDGTVVPGCSTIAKVAEAYSAQGKLIRWANKEGLAGRDTSKVSDEACSIGTILHYLAECHIQNVKPDTSSVAPAHLVVAETAFIKWVSWWDEQQYIPVETEGQMTSQKHPVGGTFDFVGKDPQGRLWMWDWKTATGVYPGHFVQLAGLKMIWEELHPGQIITGCGVGRFGKDGDWDDCEFVKKLNMEKYKAWFLCALDMYWAEKAATKRA